MLHPNKCPGLVAADRFPERRPSGLLQIKYGIYSFVEIVGTAQFINFRIWFEFHILYDVEYFIIAQIVDEMSVRIMGILWKLRPWSNQCGLVIKRFDNGRTASGMATSQHEFAIRQ